MEFVEFEPHEWEDFESFNDQKMRSSICQEDGLPKNSACFLLGFDTKDIKCLSESSYSEFSIDVGLENVETSELLRHCFEMDNCYTEAHLNNVNKGFALISNDKIWQKVVGNFGTLLPIDWQTSQARKLQGDGLKLLSSKLLSGKGYETNSCGHLETCESFPLDEDDGDDDDARPSFDMHSLILSTNLQQEPLFTAEQVISEIEEMMEELSPLPTDMSSSSEFFVLPSVDKKQSQIHEIQYESPALAKPLIGDLEDMTVLELCELYDDLECIVREYSECLIHELAKRDELEYDKELKNQFISVFLALQQKKRSYMSKNKKNKTKSKIRPSTDDSSNVLTTTIPYDHSAGPPSSELLTMYIKILNAMNEESPNLPMLLTEYILKDVVVIEMQTIRLIKLYVQLHRTSANAEKENNERSI